MEDQEWHEATHRNLREYALKPALSWLIAAALDGSYITYGDLTERLRKESGFLTIIARQMNVVAGALMDKILDRIPDAPLINVLLVNQEDRQPSEGAGTFMAKRFNEPRLALENAKKECPDLWAKIFDRAASEVYEYGPKRWAQLYEHVFDAPLTVEQIAMQRTDRKRGAEEDGIQTGRSHGSGGEGECHRRLRLWIKSNPGAVSNFFAGAEAETEVDLDSGDRVDVVFKCSDRVVLLEVKSRISNEADLTRGVYQCIKYRAVRAAMDVRKTPFIETYLVTEATLPRGIDALLRLHKIKHFQAPQMRD